MKTATPRSALAPRAISDAVISDCGQYRYTLTRPPRLPPLLNQPLRPPAVFCMLNPSTADARADDATIRRCRGFAARAELNGILVVNLYALRSTEPRALWEHEDPVGPENDHWLHRAASESGQVICAWGANAKPDRVRVAVELFRAAGARLLCLGTTKDGHPRHPLYVRGDQPLVDWP